jgi:hypothetical protein
MRIKNRLPSEVKIMFKNKHVVIAMLVAPLLALGAYFATDMIVREKPSKAIEGRQYKLVSQANCRYSSGRCEMENGNFKVTITGEAHADGRLLLNLKSVFPLEQANISVVNDPTDPGSPIEMTALKEDDLEWQVQLNIIESPNQQLRLVVAAEGAVYYGETIMPFLKYKTVFEKDFRK